MDELEAIRLISFSLIAKSRLEEPTDDPAYVYRFIYRWYSEKYSTPLHEVYELPEFDIIRAFYESKYESMSDDELEQERLDLIKTDAEREAEAKQRALEDMDGLAMVKQEEQGSSAVEKLAQEADNFKGALSKFRENLPRMTKETELGNGGVKTTLPPNIKMEFVDESELDLDSDSIGMLSDPKPR